MIIPEIRPARMTTIVEYDGEEDSETEEPQPTKC